ncbi:MAG: tRNA 4-thiouridine(8) synthase ThiI, partial [Patescibacteria group bacterium]
MAKALVLVSWGLDSMLTCRLLMEQGVEVIGLSFKSCFFGTAKAKKAAEQLGIRLIERDFSPDHLKLVKKPKYGYGKNMNPCIDCHSLMFRIAKGIMEEEGVDFVASGEILGQRPKSQNKDALGIVAKYSGLNDLLVRPMSAKHLEETRPEKEGILDRSKLMDIKGRRRDKQLELVKKFDIKQYASPGGGCILTDPAYSDRLREIISVWP